MDGAHCPQCAEYETRVMARDPETEAPDDLRPCPAYAMSPAFTAWLMDRLGPTLKAQVAASGLDRMALLKAPAPPPAGSAAGGGRRPQLPPNRMRKTKKSATRTKV